MPAPSLTQSMLDTPLNRAHTLSAYADSLQTAGSSPSSSEYVTPETIAAAHSEAAQAFTLAAKQAPSEETKATILSLAAEHTRQAQMIRLRSNAESAAAGPAVDDTQMVSQNLGADSYAILVNAQEGDPHDPFARFYKLVSGFMADNQMSNPVAFTTAPIAGSSSAGSTSDEYDFYVVPESEIAAVRLRSSSDEKSSSSNTISSTSTPLPTFSNNPVTVRETATNLLGQAAAFIRTASGFAMHGDGHRPSYVESDLDADPEIDVDGLDFDQPSDRASAKLREENKQLKQVVQQLRSRLAHCDKRDVALRSSVLKFSRDMHDETQRMRESMLILPKSVATLPASNLHKVATSTSASTTAATLIASKSINSLQHQGSVNPISASQAPSTAPLRAIISTLETQVAKLTAQNEKQRKSLARYEERWNKLKSTSTRKVNLGTVHDDVASGENELIATGGRKGSSEILREKSPTFASRSGIRDGMVSPDYIELKDDHPNS